MPVTNPSTWKIKVGTSGMQGKPQLHSKFEKRLKKGMTLALCMQLNPINIQQKPKLTP